MATKLGINGFGRIGRLVLRAIMESKEDIDVAVVNDLTDTRTNAHLFKYDSSYGIYSGKVEAAADAIVVDGKSVKVLAERDPAKIPWSDYGVEIVVESTGLFTDAAKAAAHRQGGAKKVIMIGEDELDRQEVTVRDMETKEQARVKMDDVVEYLQGEKS